MFKLVSFVCLLTFVAGNDTIKNFGIKTKNGQYSGTGAVISLTLLYNTAIYECDINPLAIDTEYLCHGSQSFIGYNCGTKQEMFIKNNDYDPVQIDSVEIEYIFITDLNGNKQTININKCLDVHDCGSNTALININTQIVSSTINSYSFSCNKISNIHSFGIKTSSGQYSGTSAVISLLFVVNSFYYKCDINPLSINTEYSCFTYNSLIGYNCNNNDQQMLIENTDNDPIQIDSVEIAKVFLNTNSGNQIEMIFSATACLDLHDCGTNKALVTINKFEWDDGTDINLSCN